MDIRPYEAYNASEMLPLYAAVGWTNYTDRPDMLKEAYAHSMCTLAAWEGGALLGVIRAVGDGHSVVWIQDILVYPQHQRRGVGTALLRAMMERYSDVYQMQLATDDTPKTVAFYKSMGFRDLREFGCAAFMRV